MRIIRLAVISLAILIAMLPLVAFASDSSNPDTNIKMNFSKIAEFLFPKPVLADVSVEEVSEPEVAPVVKTEEELKNEAILAKWKLKQAEKWANLPKEQFIINASAYTASADECGNSKGITSSGIKVHQGTIACPPAFPFGAKIKIEGYGTYTCEDRGGAIKGNKIDIYMETKAEAFAFGRRNLVAQVVE